MSQQDNFRIIREAFAAWNAHDVDRYVALLDEGNVEEDVEETHSRSSPLRGRDAARAAMREHFNVFPDLHFDVEVMITSRDQVFTRWLVAGTCRGDLTSLPPPERPIEVHGCTLSKLWNRKIIHVWRYWETDHMLLRVGTQRGQDASLPVHRVPAASGAV